MNKVIPLDGGNPWELLRLERHVTPYHGAHIAGVYRNGKIRKAANYETSRTDVPLDGAMVQGGWRCLLAANGIKQWAWVCERCQWGPNVKHSDVPVEILEGTPGWDYEYIDKWSANPTPCEHCGSTGGVELHHYAPSHLFDDSHNWPVGWLCRPCHTDWHRRTRTGAFYRQRTG